MPYRVRPTRCDQQALTWCFAADYLPGEDHTIDKPADYERFRTLKLDCWPGPQFSWTLSDFVTHEPRERPLFVGDDRRRFAVRPLARAAHRLRGGISRPAPIAATSRWATGRRWTTGTRRWSAWRRRRPPRHCARRGSSPCRSSTGCRPRRRATTAATATRACACAATCSAPPTVWRSRRTTARGAASAPSSPCWSSTSAWRRVPAAPPSASPTASASAHYRIDLHPEHARAQHRRHRRVPVPDPARRAAAGAGRQPAAGLQEHRHDAHHQRRLPGAPGRVEHRRGGRRAGGVRARAQGAAARSARRPGPAGRFPAHADGLGVLLSWPDYGALTAVRRRGYRHST